MLCCPSDPIPSSLRSLSPHLCSISTLLPSVPLSEPFPCPHSCQERNRDSEGTEPNRTSPVPLLPSLHHRARMSPGFRTSPGSGMNPGSGRSPGFGMSPRCRVGPTPLLQAQLRSCLAPGGHPDVRQRNYFPLQMSTSSFLLGEMIPFFLLVRRNHRSSLTSSFVAMETEP